MALCASRRLGFVVMPLVALALAAPGAAAAAEPTPDRAAMITPAVCDKGFGYVTNDRAGVTRCQFGAYDGVPVAVPAPKTRSVLPWG